MFSIRLISTVVQAALLSMLPGYAVATTWNVPVAGNVYSVDPGKAARIDRRGATGLSWGDANEKYAVYIHVDRLATLELSLQGRVPTGTSQLLVSSGDATWPVTMTGGEVQTHKIGSLKISQPGYFRIEIQGKERTGNVFADLRELVVMSETADLKIDYVRNNDGNMFYWGRRGPSVHLNYVLPKEAKIQYGYSELTVPKGKDPIGSYFMANGFGEGYFGIQVNGPEQRRVLFSVWSPFSTNNPKDIPADQQIKKLASGEGVHVGEFGNEGSGGQSYLIYPWKAATTYSFLTEVMPDAFGSTVYTSWFCEMDKQDWKLVASFKRPKTQSYLKRFHSFLENFNPDYGNVTRGANYGNIWVRDVDGTWHECTQARLSVDPTGKGRHRLDYNGGADGKNFFMTNGGFFNETGKEGETFTRESTANQKPEINFESLPRK